MIGIKYDLIGIQVAETAISGPKKVDKVMINQGHWLLAGWPWLGKAWTWLAGWLTGWPVGWLAGRLAGWLSGCLAGWLAGCWLGIRSINGITQVINGIH